MKSSIIFFSLFSIGLCLKIQFTLFCDDMCTDFYVNNIHKPGIGNSVMLTLSTYPAFEAQPGDTITIKIYDKLYSDVGLAGVVKIDGVSFNYGVSRDDYLWTVIDGSSYQGSRNGYPYYGRRGKEGSYFYACFKIPPSLEILETAASAKAYQFTCKSKEYYTSTNKEVNIDLFSKDIVIGIDSYSNQENPYDIKIEYDDDLKGELKIKDNIDNTESISSGTIVTNKKILTYIPDKNEEFTTGYEVVIKYYVYNKGLSYCSQGTIKIKVCSPRCKCVCSNDVFEGNFCQTQYGYSKLYYFEKEKTCLNQDEIPKGYYKNDEEEMASKCYESCGTCDKGKDDDGHQCITCAENYYFLENDEHPTNCYNTKPSENYYINGDKYSKCDERCRTCSKGAEDDTHNCDKCEKNYYFTTEKVGRCITKEEMSPGFYFESKEEFFKPCHKNCTSCLMYADENSSNCEACANEYIFIESFKGQCIKPIDKPDNFYFDDKEVKFKKCYHLCGSCKGPGGYRGNNCQACIENYFQKNSLDGNCISMENPPTGFYLNKEEKVFKPCYDTCINCSDEGTLTAHKCTKCVEKLEFTTGNNLGNCLKLEEIEPKLEEVQQFLPIKVPLSDSYDIKRLQIKDDFNLYYYTSSTTFKDTSIPYIKLNECERELKEFYGLDSNEVIFIGSIIENNKTSNISFSLYDKNGNELDIAKCQSKIEKIYPIIKDFNQSSLVSSVLDDKTKIGSNFNLYNSSSTIYNDRCTVFQVNQVNIPLRQRREMFLKELQFCPKDCTYSTHSVYSKTVTCLCTSNNIDENSNLLFGFPEIQHSSFSLFSCGTLFSYYPSSNSFLHWIAMFLGIGIIICSVVFNIRYPRIMDKIFPAPKPKSRSRKSNRENMIEMTPRTTDTSNQSSSRKNLVKIDKSLRLSTSSKTPNISSKRKSTTKDSKCSSEKKKQPKEIPSNCHDDFKFLVSEKIILGSIVTNVNEYYVIYSRIGNNLALLSFIILMNCLFFKEAEDHSIKHNLRIDRCFYSALISFLFYKFLFILGDTINVYSDYIRSIINCGFTFSIIVSFLSWYYLFLFGLIFDKDQISILIQTVLSIIFIIILQVLLALIISLFRACCRNSKFLLLICSILDILF